MKSFKFTDTSGSKWIFSSDSSGESFLTEFAKLLNLEEYQGKGTNNILFTENYNQLKSPERSRIINNSHIELVIRSSNDLICHIPPMDKYCFPDPGPIETIVDSAFCNNFSGVGFKRIEIIRVFIALCLLGGIRFGTPIHGAMLGYEEKGILITGPSGAGKSTCAGRANGKFRAYCDDISMVTRKGSTDFFVHPLPSYKNSFKNCEISGFLPLTAIFYLIQSKEDYAVRLSSREAVSPLYEAIHVICNYSLSQLPKDGKNNHLKQVFNHAADIAQGIPMYYLNCTNSENFMKTIGSILEG
jgi:SynChlorMet cassette protein ScmC